jgi:hypothetical protein
MMAIGIVALKDLCFMQVQKSKSGEVKLPVGNAWDWAARSDIDEIDLHILSNPDDPTSPVRQYEAAKKCAAMRAAIENNAEDRGFKILRCMRECAAHSLVIPEWLARAYIQAFDAVDSCDAISWDAEIAFGKPYKKGTRNAHEKRDRKMALVVWKEVAAAVGGVKAKRFNNDLFEQIGKPLGLSRDTARKLYNMAVKFYGLTELKGWGKLSEQDKWLAYLHDVCRLAQIEHQQWTVPINAAPYHAKL